MNPKIKHSRDRAFKRFVYIFFFLMCACFVLPLIVVISASFTSEQALTSGGFSLLPRDFTLDAYKSAFSSGTRVLRAYGVTIFQAVVGTVLSRNESLYTLQYLLQRMMDQAEFMKNLANNPMMSGSVSLDTSMLPSESLKFAMCVIAAGPMLVVFPFFQKYFAQGLTIGAVKG